MFQCKEQEGAELEIGFPGKLVCSSCQIRAGGAMLSRDEMTELFTACTRVPFGGTAATFFIYLFFLKGISCHSAWTWASPLSHRLFSVPVPCDAS